MKYPSTITSPGPSTTTTTVERDMGPVEVAFVSMFACAFAGVLVALFLDRPIREMGRWLIGGAMLPIAIVIAATVARLFAWMLNARTWRTETARGVDINGDGMVGRPDTIRLIPVRAQSPRIRLSGDDDDDGYEPADLRALVHHAYTAGHQARSFYGMILPSGRPITGYADIAPFLRMLERSGLLVDRSERKSGRLIDSEAEALQRFGLF